MKNAQLSVSDLALFWPEQPPTKALLLTSPVSSLLRAVGFPCPLFSLGVSSVWNFSLECRCWAGPGHSATSSKLKKKVCPSCRHQCLLWPAGEGRARLLAGGDPLVPRPPCWVREGSQALAKACEDRWAALRCNPLFIYWSKLEIKNNPPKTPKT